MLRVFIALVGSVLYCGVAAADPLPSWNDTDSKSSIIAFVEAVTDPNSDSYVTRSDRVAVFDNDGTLWAEKPVYFQLVFAIDRLRTLAEADPSVLTSDSLKAAARGDMESALAGGEEALLEIITVSHSGLTVEAFIASANDWLATARHPETGLAYKDMVYQPMLELLRYLRDEGFSTYIVSGGGVHFLRAFAEDTYGVPPENTIGSSGKSSYQVLDGTPAIVKEPGIAFVNDKAGKPVAIDTRLGKRPIFVGGNSDGDFEMLEWATSGPGPRFGLIVHHTDGDREWAYDREGHVGRLNRGLDEAADRNWLLVDMANDWKTVFPAQAP